MPGVAKLHTDRSCAGKRSAVAWTDILILAPVVVLAVVGFMSFRQDHAAAERAATERAQEIAVALGARLKTALLPDAPFLHALPELFMPMQFTRDGMPPGQGWVEIAGKPEADPILLSFDSPANPLLVALLDENNRVIYPPPPLSPPTSPVSQSEDEVALWYRAQQAEFVEKDPSTAAESYLALISRYPKSQRIAEARYNLGLIQQKLGELDAATEGFKKLEGADSSSALTESGFPITPMARLQSLPLRGKLNGSAGLNDLGRSAVAHPSLMTPDILRRAGTWERENLPASHGTIEDWQEVWRVHEMARSLARQFQGGEPAWRTIDGADWLTLKGPVLRYESFLLGISETELRRRSEAVLKSFPVPRYFGVGVEVAGKPLIGLAPNVEKPHGLAESLDRLSDGRGQTMPVKVSIYLTDVHSLYAAEQRRQWVFGGLIVFATVIAFLGTWRSRRALQRQLRLNELKSDFVSSVSHELRTPIASVRLMAESLERGKIGDPARQHEYFRVIGMECRRLSCLIENVLDFSRIEENRKQYEFESVDPVALVEQTVRVLQPNAEERKVRLEVVLNQRTESAELDGKAIQQALVNLIDNAIKHAPPGSAVTVGLELLPPRESDGRAAEETAAHLVFWVEDKGPGIPAEEHERIFERFYRVGSELRRETQGVGIGLSIVKHIVEAHGGRVFVRSEPGTGSRFSIDIPQQATNPSPKPVLG